MIAADPALIQVVREDLRYLFSKWPKGEISDDELRRSSCVLRRLLTYSDLHKVWVTLVGKKEFLVPSTWIEIRDPRRLPEIDFATASPAESSPGNRLFSVVVYRKIQNGDEPIRLMEEAPTPLYTYLFQKTAIVEGVPASRNDIVQFVANKLGGAHYDIVHQKPSDKALDAIRKFEVMNRKAAMHELLSYGQQLERSESAHELLQSIDEKG
ncbi:MAG: hypothetical protein Q8J74_14735 [Candidatus Didemnitutus sp.]|nr:hypothetical protein [Candidatus Didemnitutus sp.]